MVIWTVYKDTVYYSLLPDKKNYKAAPLSGMKLYVLGKTQSPRRNDIIKCRCPQGFILENEIINDLSCAMHS